MSTRPAPLMTTAATSPQPPPLYTQPVPPSPSTPSAITRDSRPDIAAWPAPPPTTAVSLIKSARTAAGGNSSATSTPTGAPRTTSTGTSPIPESHFLATAAAANAAALDDDEGSSGKLLAMLRMATITNAGERRRLFARISAAINLLQAPIMAKTS